MGTPTNPAPHPKPFAEIAADLAVAALHGQNVEIGEDGGKKVAEFYKTILAGISPPATR